MGNQTRGAAVSEVTDYERKIIDNVAEYGCQVSHVFDPDQINPDFSYSIGFPETVAQPEVIIFGLSNTLMHSMINETLHQCREWLVLSDGVRISNLIEGFDCIAREVPEVNIEVEYFNSAMWFSRHSGHGNLQSAFQLVWPGAVNGLFPWEQGAAQEVIDAQPPLYEQAA